MERAVSGERALQEVRLLCERFGARLAGTANEAGAAEHIAARWESFGVREVAIEPFPCLSWEYTRAFLSVDGVEVPCLPVAHAPATPDDGIDAELVYVETASEIDLARVPVAGRVALLSTLYGEDRAHFQRLLECRPAALLFVDDRLPFDWTVAVGFPARWVSALSVPMASISFQHAWNIVRSGGRRVRLEIHSCVREALSQNVTGVIPGTDASAGEVVVTCHHDTVVNSVGGEDNGSGVGCALELARVFSASAPRRPIRFLSCGCEEQLSEGAKHYVLAHQGSLPSTAFVLNTDSVGCWMGQNEITVAGSGEMRSWVETVQRRTGFSGKILDQVSPYSDHFPFTACGVPAIWVHRRNCAGGRFFHHSALDAPDVLSPAVLQDTLQFEAHLIAEAANAAELPFPREIPESQRGAIARYWRDLYGVGT